VRRCIHVRQQHFSTTIVVTLVVTLIMGWLIWDGTKSTLSSFFQSSQFIRIISGLPQDVHGWDIFTYYGKVFIYPIEVEEAPFTIYRIDPNNERIVESIIIDQIISPQAIIARHYQLPDAWLAEQGFFMWEIDQQTNIAYATKPEKLPSKVQEYVENGFEGVYVIDMITRKVKNFIKYPGFLHMILHPSGKKLYIEAPEGKVRVLDTERLEWVKEFFVGDYFALLFTGFSDDGKYLFCGYNGYKGFIVINTEKDEVETWAKQINEEIYDKYNINVIPPYALSEDKQEVYAAAHFVEGNVDIFNEPGVKAKGGVITIDLSQRKVTRMLGLSRERECTGAVVIGNKLFVSSWNDIFVIDIDHWRKR